MKVVLVIPTYNRVEHLKELLPQVVKQGFHKIYVLDDGSTDGSDKVCKQFPEVKVIKGVKNLGPSGNRNRVLGQDLGDAIFFLDDDVRLETPKVPKIVEAIFIEHSKAGVISASILDMNRQLVLFNYERESNPLFRKLERPFIGPAWPDEAFDKPYVPVAWVIENAFAIRSQIFKDLGGFDPAYRKFQEGPDLCKRVLATGYEVAITNKMTAVHTVPYSIFQFREYLKYLRASVIWYWKHAFGR